MQKQEVKIPGVTGKFGLGVQNEAGQRLTEFCQEKTLVKANTLFQQSKRRLYTWTSLDGQYQNQTDYILCSRRWTNYVQSAKTKPGVDCASGHQLLIAKSTLKLKKVGKTTRPIRCNLGQIANKYTVEMTNRFRGLALVNRVPEGLWTEVHNPLQEAVNKTISKGKKMQRRQSGYLRWLYKQLRKEEK